jgi:hypothetical protein
MFTSGCSYSPTPVGAPRNSSTCFPNCFGRQNIQESRIPMIDSGAEAMAQDQGRTAC